MGLGFNPKAGSMLCRMGLLAALCGGTTLTAGVILDTGVVNFSPTGTQFGRISRDGNSAIWGVTKTFPGVVNAPSAIGYETFEIFDTGERGFYQISLDDPTVGLFMAAYLNSFNPVNSGPNFGLDVNYLGDPGASQPFDAPSFFQIFVTPHSHLVIPINEINPGGGAGRSFELLVEAFYDSSFSESPEPNSFVLCGAGALALCLARFLSVRASKKSS